MKANKNDLFDRAREAALAQPEPEPAGLSDEELLPQQFRDDLATVSRMAAHGAGPDVGAGLFRVSLNTGALEFARAVEAATLARAQRQPEPPEPGEAQELVEWLRELGAKRGGVFDVSTFCANLTRAAELLSQRHPQPVPVSERPWEREGWCDEQGKCWWGRGADDYCNHDWHYATRAEVEEFCSNAMPQTCLPAHALPLPEEVEG